MLVDAQVFRRLIGVIAAKSQRRHTLNGGNLDDHVSRIISEFGISQMPLDFVLPAAEREIARTRRLASLRGTRKLQLVKGLGGDQP